MLVFRYELLGHSSRRLLNNILPYILAFSTVILLFTGCNLSNSPEEPLEEPLQKHSVVYDKNGATSGEVPPEQIKIEGESLTLPGNPGTLTKTGFSFIGWNTMADKSGTFYTPQASYSAEEAATLYAHWGWDQADKVIAEDGMINDSFGTSTCLSADGQIALIGASGGDGAYVYTYDGKNWSKQAKLIADDGADGDNFGNSVSLSSDGKIALIGSFGNDDTTKTDAGAAYVYMLEGGVWQQKIKLTAKDTKAYSYFGASVSLSADGSTALIGARQDSGKVASAGAAYVYTYDGKIWTEQGKLYADDADAKSADQFGYSVSLSADGLHALVGAYRFDNTNSTDAGAAYVYAYSGTKWTQQAKLTAESGAANDWFGYSVSLSGDGINALVGAYKADDTTNGVDSGSVYVYNFNGQDWNKKVRLTAKNGGKNDRFGSSVSLSFYGRSALIGASGDHSNPGSAYVYSYNGTNWTEETRLTAKIGTKDDDSNDEEFGSSVSLSSNGMGVLVAAHRDNNVKGIDAGSVYFFQ